MISIVLHEEGITKDQEQYQAASKKSGVSNHQQTKNKYNPSIIWSFRILSFVQPMAQHIVMAHLFFFEESVFPEYRFRSGKNKTVAVVSLTVALFATGCCVFCWIYNWIMQKRAVKWIHGDNGVKWIQDCSHSDNGVKGIDGGDNGNSTTRATHHEITETHDNTAETQEDNDFDIESQKKALLGRETAEEEIREKLQDQKPEKSKRAKSDPGYFGRFDFETRFCIAAGMQLIGCVLFASALVGMLPGLICYFSGCVLIAAGVSWWVGAWVGITLI